MTTFKCLNDGTFPVFSGKDFPFKGFFYFQFLPKVGNSIIIVNTVAYTRSEINSEKMPQVMRDKPLSPQESTP